MFSQIQERETVKICENAKTCEFAKFAERDKCENAKTPIGVSHFAIPFRVFMPGNKET
jgi:hypothetical protein